MIQFALVSKKEKTERDYGGGQIALWNAGGENEPCPKASSVEGTQPSE